MSSSQPTGAHNERLNFSWFRRLPLIDQAESSECGLACLAMIACYHGNHCGLAQLRRRFQPSLKGSNLKQLVDIADTLGFLARAIRVDTGSLPHLQTPCILHWDMNHFVVLKRVGPRRARIHDPARGVLDLSRKTLSGHFTGIALELTPSADFERLPPGVNLRLSDLWTRIVGLRRHMALILLLSALLQLFALAAPIYMQTVIDDVVLRGDRGLLTALAVGFLLLLLIESGTQLLRAIVILQLSSRLHLQLALNLFSHLIRLPLDFFQRRHLGDILSRFSSLEKVRDILGTGLVTAVVDGAMAAVMLVVMLLYDTTLSLVVIGILTVYTVARIALFPRLRRLSEESIALHARSESSLIESIRAIQTVKLYQRESGQQASWHNRLADALNTDIRVARMDMGLQAVNTLVFGIENIVVVYLAALAVMTNTMSLGMVFAFMSYKQRFTGAIDRLIDQVIELKMLGLHLQRISDIALTRREASAPLPGNATSHTQRPVTLAGSRLGYRYSESDPWVFQGLHVEVEAGCCLAITGPSGSGKTTLLKCLMGIYPLTEGRLQIDGAHAARGIDYRSRIGSVMQDDRLLSGTIGDNIACFDYRPDLEWLQHCARIACIHDSILAMPMQYETPVGDMGSTLSGGQVQRILLARALYRRPGILFLDEATSHVDTDTEHTINCSIAAMKLTRVIVAHRPESTAFADSALELGDRGHQSRSPAAG